MPSKTKNPLAEAMRELKAIILAAGIASPVVRTTPCQKSEVADGREGTRIIAGHCRRRSSPSSFVCWPLRRETRSKDCYRKP